MISVYYVQVHGNLTDYSHVFLFHTNLLFFVLQHILIIVQIHHIFTFFNNFMFLWMWCHNIANFNPSSSIFTTLIVPTLIRYKSCQYTCTVWIIWITVPLLPCSCCTFCFRQNRHSNSYPSQNRVSSQVTHQLSQELSLFQDSGVSYPYKSGNFKLL